MQLLGLLHASWTVLFYFLPIIKLASFLLYKMKTAKNNNRVLLVDELRNLAFDLARATKKLRAANHGHPESDIPMRWRSEIINLCEYTHSVCYDLLRLLDIPMGESIGLLRNKLSRRLNVHIAVGCGLEEIIARTIDWDLCTIEHVVLGVIEEIGETTKDMTNATPSPDDTAIEIADILWYAAATKLTIENEINE